MNYRSNGEILQSDNFQILNHDEMVKRAKEEYKKFFRDTETDVKKKNKPVEISVIDMSKTSPKHVFRTASKVN